MPQRATRLARGFVVAAFATFVAAFSHVIGGGEAPHPMLLVAVLLFTGMLATAVVGRRASWAGLAASVTVTQVGFHFLFDSAGAGSLTVIDHAHAGYSVPVAAVQIMHAGHAAVGMPLAHAVAGVLTLLALRFGDAALAGLVDTARFMLGALVRVACVPLLSPPVTLVSTVPADPARRPLFSGYLCCDPRRGPPALVSPALG